MTTLKTQFTQLREQYQIKQQVQSLEEVYDRYRTIRDGLLDVAEPLQKAQKKFEVIGMLPEPHSTIDFSQEAALFGGAKTQLDALTARFKESGDKTEQSGFWETVRVLKSVQESIDDKVDATWKAFVADLEARAMLDSVFLEQQRTLGNVLVYDDYRKARDNFNRQKLSGPDSLSVVKNLQKYSDEMVALKRSMDPDATDDVLRFFEALDRHNHASLTLLTPGVIAWLEEKGMLPAFNVTRKRMI